MGTLRDSFVSRMEVSRKLDLPGIFLCKCYFLLFTVLSVFGPYNHFVSSPNGLSLRSYSFTFPILGEHDH